MKRIWKPQAIMIPMLLMGLARQENGFYILLRVICCAGLTYMAVEAWKQTRQNWLWVLGVGAVIYNPFVQLHLGRNIWEPVNVVTIAVLIFSVFTFRLAPST